LKKPLTEQLSKILSPKELSYIRGSFDIVGGIAIIRISKASEKHAKIIADTIMTIHKNIRTVLAQIGSVSGDFRLRNLVYIAGENRTNTIHKESGCLFSVDVNTCYFSPRLSHERIRTTNLVQPNEIIVNMFAGVGCFSILIAKHINNVKIYSIDINPVAVQFMTENIKLNRLYGKVIPILGDAKTIITNQLKHCADRVLMPLPEKAYEYLPYALLALKQTGGWIHIHTFEHASKTENPNDKVKKKVIQAFNALGVNCQISHIHIVRSTGPNWWQLVADIRVEPHYLVANRLFS
jgi:tRNA (guanine37-N1)-methyltransferase